MSNPAILLALIWMCAVYFAAAVYVGKNGFARTFAPNNPQFGCLALLVLSPVPLVLWIQKTYAYTAGGTEFLIVTGAVVVGLVVGQMTR